MHKRIEKLNEQIEQFKNERKLLIKLYEQELMSRLEMDIISVLEESSFDVVEHQLGHFIHAKRGINELRVWLPQQKEIELGHVTLKVTYNTIQFSAAALINHKFANVEYNYLTADYNAKLKRKTEELSDELEELNNIGLKDIDGSYVLCTYNEGKASSGELKTLRQCFSELVNNKRDKS